jgi:hypothetical protein
MMAVLLSKAWRDSKAANAELDSAGLDSKDPFVGRRPIATDFNVRT